MHFLEVIYALQMGQKFLTQKKYTVKIAAKKPSGWTSYLPPQILGAVIAKPGLSQGIPFCSEPITRQDGSTKNDCERNAFHRFLLNLKKEHPRLKLTIVSDALSANAPHINELYELGYDFIIVAKSEGNRSIFEWIKGVTQEEKIAVGKNRYTFRYVIVSFRCGL